jgi:NitT/TauT family transport system substrate-binding protein
MLWKQEAKMKRCPSVRRHVSQLAWAGVLLLALSFPDQASSQTTGPTSLKFRQSFIPSEQYIPELVAIEKGMYAAQGLTVEMLRSTGGGNAATLVAAGNDQLGVAGAADVLIAGGKGLDIVAVAINSPEDPTAIISLDKNPIRSVTELRGKRIGAIAGSTAFALLQALLKSNKLSESDVKIVLIGAGDLISSVISQQVDGIAAFETTNVPAMRAAGANPVSLRFADVGLRVPGNVYIANGQFARTNPDVVARFLVGTIRGWDEVSRHGYDEGLALLLKTYPELVKQRDMLAQRWEFRVENKYNPYSPGKPLTVDAFKFEPRSIETLSSALVSAGLVPSGMSLQMLFSNNFIDQAQKLMK